MKKRERKQVHVKEVKVKKKIKMKIIINVQSVKNNWEMIIL